MHSIPEHIPPLALHTLPMVMHPLSRVHAYEIHYILDAGCILHPFPEHLPPLSLHIVCNT